MGAPRWILSRCRNVEQACVRGLTHGHVKNVAMVYTVGPQRRDCSSDIDFLERVRAMAGNVATACAEYNALGTPPQLEVLRVCLVSGGAFAGGVPKQHVARAICKGIRDVSDHNSAP